VKRKLAGTPTQQFHHPLRKCGATCDLMVWTQPCEWQSAAVEAGGFHGHQVTCDRNPQICRASEKLPQPLQVRANVLRGQALPLVRFRQHALICEQGKRAFVVGLTRAALGSVVHFPEIDRLWNSPMKTGITCILLMVAMLIFHYRERLWKPARLVFLAGFILVNAIAFLQAFQLMQVRIRTLPEWDVRVFWIYGQLTAHGENVYALESYQRFYKELNPDRDFTEAVMRVGATYPPPTMFLFRPLGCCAMQSAFGYWYVFLGLCVLVAIELLRRTFVKNDGLWGLAFVVLLIFGLHGTWDTIRFGQTNFLALVLLLLYWRDREDPWAGIWVALGAVIKLYMGVLLLDALLLKRWRVLTWAALMGLVLSVTSLMLLGPRTFVSYFTLHPISRVPAWVYVEWMNQSLLGTILRLTHAPIAGGSLGMNPVFLASALILIVETAWLVYRLDPASVWSLPLWVLLALIIYPGTLAHYSVMLLPVLLLIWKEREKTPLGAPASAIFITLIIGLVGFHSHAFTAHVVTWIAIAGLAVWTGPRDQRASASFRRLDQVTALDPRSGSG